MSWDFDDWRCKVKSGKKKTKAAERTGQGRRIEEGHGTKPRERTRRATWSFLSIPQGSMFQSQHGHLPSRVLTHRWKVAGNMFLELTTFLIGEEAKRSTCSKADPQHERTPAVQVLASEASPVYLWSCLVPIPSPQLDFWSFFNNLTLLCSLTHTEFFTM